MNAKDGRTFWKTRLRSFVPDARITVIHPTIVNSVIVALIAIVILVAAWTSITTTKPSSDVVRGWQMTAGILGVILWLAMAGLVWIMVEDIRFAQTPEQKMIARHHLWQAVLWLISATFLSGLLVEIWFQRYKGVITWVIKHPLAQFELIVVCAIVAITTSITTTMWYHWLLHRSEP